MIQKVFGVRDCKAEAFLQPFFSVNSGAAVRAFADAANDGQSPIAKHPGDYNLYELGSFDDASGKLTDLSPMRMLGCAADFIEVKVPSFSSLAKMPLQEAGVNGDSK